MSKLIKFSQTHYEAVAKVMSKTNPDNLSEVVNEDEYASWARVVKALSDAFQADNPNFDRNRFQYACCQH